MARAAGGCQDGDLLAKKNQLGLGKLEYGSKIAFCLFQYVLMMGGTMTNIKFGSTIISIFNTDSFSEQFSGMFSSTPKSGTQSFS